MKYLSIPLFILFICTFTQACKKSSGSSTSVNPVIPRGFYGQVNGNIWTGNTISYNSIIGNGTNNLVLYAYNDTTGISVELLLNNFKTKGTFGIPSKNDSAFYSTDYGTFNVFNTATTGQVAIQLLTDSSVGGTFYFVAGTNTITSGTFNVNF